MDSQVDSQVHASRKQVLNFTRIQLTCDQLVSTCVGWPNGEKLASTCVRVWARPKSTQVVANQRKWVAKRNASWTQVKNLRRLASPFGHGLNRVITLRTQTSVTWRAQSACVKIDLLRSLLQTRKPNVQIRPRFLANTTRRKKQKKSKPNHVMTWFPD